MDGVQYCVDTLKSLLVLHQSADYTFRFFNMSLLATGIISSSEPKTHKVSL